MHHPYHTDVARNCGVKLLTTITMLRCSMPARLGSAARRLARQLSISGHIPRISLMHAKRALLVLLDTKLNAQKALAAFQPTRTAQRLQETVDQVLLERSGRALPR